jgi:predicted secreted hydrolase
LSAATFSINTTGIWTSPATGRQYPGQWEIRVPGQDLSLAVTPVIQNQEHTHLFSYWEGAARFIGNGINGLGYVELTGY